MSDLFNGPRLKIERAYQHIQDIEGRIAVFSVSNAHTLVTEFDAVTRSQKVKFQSTERLPEFVTLIFGDAVHNLRTSLDYAWAQAILALDPNADISNLHFPCGLHSRDSCKGTLDDRKQEHAVAIATPTGQKLRELILDTLKPYGTRDTPFAMLNKLDNIDKHRLLLTLYVRGGARISDMRIGTARLINMDIVDVGPKGALIGTNQKMEGEMHPLIEVLIYEAELPPHQPLIPTLKNVAKVVSQAVDAIDSCISTHRDSP
jgi:hypothetical protein